MNDSEERSESLSERKRGKVNSVVRCLICQKQMPEYDPMFCCSGHECSCMGLPTNPQICSQRCMTACIDGIGKPMEQRRIDAGIELDTANDIGEGREATYPERSCSPIQSGGDK